MGSGSKCAKSVRYRPIHVALIEVIIWDAVLILLNGVSSKMDCYYNTDLAPLHVLPDPTTSVRQYLSPETCYDYK